MVNNMRVLIKTSVAVLLLCVVVVGTAAFPTDDAEVDTPIHTNTIHRFVPSVGRPGHDETKSLKKVFLSNKSVTCNDGSQAGFYLRKSHTSKKWIVFLEGGWYCYDKYSCHNRWLRQRHYMTSAHWQETKDVGGILSPNEDENPYWWNANHVFVPYCTSDTWSGSKSTREGMFNFMGAAVVQQVIRDLVPLGLENSTDLLLTGSSAGGTGVLINLDPVQELLHDMLELRHIAVRGVTDSGWFLDRTPYAPNGKLPMELISKGMELWQGKVPRLCRQKYLDEPWRCYVGHLLYPTLKNPLFVFQWLFDEAQMLVDNVGAPVTKQQWDYIHKMGDALRHSFENVTAVFAPSCISHSVLTKRDWQSVQIDDVSIAEALHAWEEQPLKNVIRRMTNSSLLLDEPVQQTRQVKRRSKTSQKDNLNNNSNAERKRRRRKKHREQNQRKHNKHQENNSNENAGKKNRKRKGRRQHHGEHKNRTNRKHSQQSNILRPTEHPRPQRSVLRSHQDGSSHRRLERCTWPQCNHTCPRLHNPFTGEEMDFIELLKSFGLDMESVATALGIDMATLNNMEDSELLNLLTQQAN